uniref:beta-galactosidase n=1 Tax=Salix viminalis TaxID=40686 RepID=A0A6N2NGX5_SALVM
MRGSWVSILLIASLGLIGSCSAAAVEYDSSAVIINGERKIILSGSIHYPRSTVEIMVRLNQKARKEDLIRLKLFPKVQEAGLHGILRIGPYACAEWNYGGFPVWLHNIPDIKFRTDNEIFKNEMQTFTTKIVNMAKEAKLFASQGGPIILAQPKIQGALDHVQQSDAPSTVINTCNGFYCDAFTPNNPKNPKIWTENWTGWFKKWGQKDPHRTAEDLAFSVARFFQHNGVLQNYYMYHGGTNFGRTSGGNLNQPKWGHLKKLHAALKLGEKILTNSTVKTANYSDGWVELTTFTSNINGERLCFLSNTKMDDVNVDLQQDGNYSVPAWSVNVQTSLIVKKLQENDTLKNSPGAATNDQSDYLWYMTRFQHDYSFTFEKPALLKPGRNIISLLSATVGLQNYGEFFDEGTEGIAGAAITTDLSSNEWSYKVGLIGEGINGLFFLWSAMTWYKTTFQAPSGTEPVVVDLQGMGKGHAWVNGNSLGRFWPTLTADPTDAMANAITEDNIRRTNACRIVAIQLKDGNRRKPSNVSFQFTATETICGNAYEGTTLELSCNGGRRTISDIQFASFGDPQGSTCGSFQRGSVEASSSLSAVEKACLGKESCSINVSKTTFGVGDSFGVDTNRLAVQAVCK